MKNKQEKGNQLREPYSKLILTNGFIKKTQKTPRKEIKLAKLRRQDYIERCKNNEDIK